MFLPQPKKKEVQKQLGLRSDQVKQLSKKSLKKLKNPKSKFVNIIKEVHQYFNDNSRILPLKKKASKHAPQRALLFTNRQIYKIQFIL